MSVGVGKRSDLVRGIVVAVVALTTGVRAPETASLRPASCGACSVSDVHLAPSGLDAGCGALRAFSADGARLRETAPAPVATDTLVRSIAPLARIGFQIGTGEGTSPVRHAREARTPECRGEAP